MDDLIKIQAKNLFLLNKDLLGLDEAQLWIGKADGPSDDDDKRVQREREEAKTKGEIYGIEAVDLKSKDGWFEVDVQNWPAGVYRLMLHGKAGIKAPNGTELKNERDLEYFWPKISEETLKELSEEQKKFIYREKNGRGFCFRIKINENREIIPAGEL